MIGFVSGRQSDHTGGVALSRRPNFEPLFTTHPSEVGSVLAAMLRGPLSHPIGRQTTAFCGGFERDSRCIGLDILSSPITSQEMCHLIPDCLSRQTALDSSSSHPWSHSTAQEPCSCLASTCSDVSSRPPCFEFFVMEGHISTISQF